MVDVAETGRISSVSVVHGLLPAPWGVVAHKTAIDKRPVPGPVEIGPLGLAGDDQIDRKHHGGRGKAVYAYADEDAAWWAAELEREIEPGLFGENLRTAGIDVTGAEIGERWAIGPEVLLEVTMPRTLPHVRRADAGEGLGAPVHPGQPARCVHESAPDRPGLGR